MDIFIRYLAKTDCLPNKFPTKAYDLRIFYILDGKGEINLADERYPLAKGSFCYCPTGVEYYPLSASDNPLKFIVINFDLSHKNKHIQNFLTPVKSKKFNQELGIFSQNECELELFKQPFVIQNALFIEEILLNTEMEYKKNTIYATEIAESYLKCALLKLAEFKNQKGNHLYNKIINYISNNYKTIKSNDDVAAALGYHSFYLSNVLQHHSGLTLHKYIKKFRLTKAAELLAFTDMSIAEITNEIGMDNPNHFYNIFSKEYGVSPSAYRNSIKTI